MKPLRTLTVLLILVLLVPKAAYAYIDPGTTQSLFAILAPLLAIFGVFLGYMLWPFRTALSALFGRGKASEEGAAAAEDDPAPTEPEQEADRE